MHHGINISAFIKPAVALTQFNNAAILSFGSMISLLSPLLLKVFAKFRLKLPTIEINAVFEEIRENDASKKLQENTDSGEFRESTTSKQFRKIDRCYDFKEIVASEEFRENANSGEFSGNVDFGEFSKSAASGEFRENIVFEEFQVRDNRISNLRRFPSYLLDIININKIENADSGEYRGSGDSEEVRKRVDSEEIKKRVDSDEVRKCVDTEKFRESAVSEEFRLRASADEAVKQFNENLDSQILVCKSLNQQHTTFIKRSSTVLEMMGKSFVLLPALPEEREEEDN